MNEQLARDVVLVRAIESSDTAHVVLSDDDRMYASRSARELAQWQAADSKSAVTFDLFLQQRSEQILKRLAERTPAVKPLLKGHAAAAWFAIGLPLLALLAGALLDRIADPHRVDLLSAPLLGIIGWNLVVYACVLVFSVAPAKKTGGAGTAMLRRFSVGRAPLPRKLPAALAAGLTRFIAEWAQLSAKLLRVRLARTFHLAAAAFALGALVSLYARGLTSQYGAGWESTFLDASQVHQILSLVFVPALFVFPLQGFSLADVEALRFTGTTVAGSGARWVHLYAATVLLLVVLPRGLLSIACQWRVSTLRRNFPIDIEQPYFRKLSAQIGNVEPGLLRVLPYSYTLDEARDRGLAAIATALLGEQARVMLRPSLAYGEDAVEAIGPDTSGVTVTAVLFSLAATPETENHGALLDQLRRASPRGIAVLVDESSLTQRVGTQPGADARLAERIALWRQFCHFHGCSATIVNLLDPDRYPVDAEAGLIVSEAS
ncbi:DUF2868 domain-containing protein [Massilia sp. S19_KUP03_FR1]|uniref:DUF2868 domain-containing protein n=1 Tax=Massilia sp. S19_KUP03_FR1 TaxID=3025503 RepID=UPI002FCD7FF7